MTQLAATKILVVDDNRMIHGLIETALEDCPFQVFHAYDGSEAVRLYYGQQPSLMLLDIDMPVMNGFQVLEHLNVKAKEECPVIVMSGLATAREQEQCLNLGAKMFLGKPFQIVALVKSIKLLLEQQWGCYA